MLGSSLNKATGWKSEEDVGLRVSCVLAGAMLLCSRINVFFFSFRLLFPTECTDEFRRLMTVCLFPCKSFIVI